MTFKMLFVILIIYECLLIYVKLLGIINTRLQDAEIDGSTLTLMLYSSHEYDLELYSIR